MSQDPDNLAFIKRCVKENDRWREVRKATEKRLSIHNGAYFFQEGDLLKGAQIQTQKDVYFG